MSAQRLTLPDGTTALLDDEKIGRIETVIRRCRRDDGSIVFFKQGKADAAIDLVAEHDRLQWLEGKLPVPRVLAFRENADGAEMLLSSVPGTASHESGIGPQAIVNVLADGLHAVHALPVESCPFRETLEQELAESERRMRENKLDREAFVEGTGGLTPEETLDYLRRTKGIIRTIVFTHGDYCLPNVLISADEQLSGFVDWGIAGLADLHRDFMAISDSIRMNLGDEWVEPFYARYGYDNPDPERLRYYTLLDQFFAHYAP